ncbi:MAG: alpha-2-macroglobulin family protein [Acidobacteriota bacterium]
MSRISTIIISRRRVSLLLLLVAAVFASGAACGQVGRSSARPAGAVAEAPPTEATKDGAQHDEATAGSGEAMAENPRWKEVDRLISEQKMEAAITIADEILAEARAAGNDVEHTRALIKGVQLRTALHGYETTVRDLRQKEWPQAPQQRAVLNLFYARSLVRYLQQYSWEINQRERVDTGEEIDLKTWTRDQIVGEAHRAYVEVWNDRQSWGDASLGALAEYMQQNDYPARIRGTLRDAVTYLWTELLVDTSLWRPEHDSGTYRLDLAALLAKEPTPAKLDDPSVHPLLRLVTILADLESWHRERQQPEAAFEARLERLRRLWSHFTVDEDQATLRASLEDALDDLGKRYEWWSSGMALLAERTRNRGDEALVEARRIALAGAEAHPRSPGGLHCRHIVAAIEAPSYELSAMAIDGPRQRSIQVQHRNLPELHFRAYALDLERRLQKSQDYNLLPNYRDVPPILAAQKPIAEWSVELPETPDYRQHQTFVTPPLESSGLYLVVASARRDFAPDGNQQSAVNMVISDLVLLTRTDSEKLEATVRSGASGTALPNVQVDLYRHDYRRGHTKLDTRATDGEGRVTFGGGSFSRGNHFLVARHGDQVGLSNNVQQPFRHRQSDEATGSLIFTDRSIYRPQQKILWKIVAFRGNAEKGAFQTQSGSKVTVTLLDSNSQEIAAAEVETNEFGSASGEFEIPTGRLLGRWRLASSLDGMTSVRVEEYKRPTFEVTVSDPERALRLNRPAELAGEVRYYFGLPVVTGEVAWRVVREPVYPTWGWHFWAPTRTSSETIASGETTLDTEGKFHVRFTPEADERLGKAVSYRYRLSVDVTDEGGETRSASRAFRLGFVAVETFLHTDGEFFRQGEPVELTARRKDLDGLDRPGKASWRLLAIDQPKDVLLPAELPAKTRPFDPTPEPDPTSDAYETPGDRQRARWDTRFNPRQTIASWADGAELEQGDVEHGSDGGAALRFTDLAPGAYRLRYTTQDDFGAEFETATDFLVVAQKRTQLALPAVLLAEDDYAWVGDTVRFFVHTGLDDQEMTFELFQGGERIERRRLQSGDAQLIELPVRDEHRGGFLARLTTVRDHQLMTLSQEISVPWRDRLLKLEFATFRDRLRPGDEETWRIVVKGSDEKVVSNGAAELLAYMYDRSLDTFAPHRPARPLGLYPRRIAHVALRSNLGLANRAWHQSQDFARIPNYPRFSSDRLKFYDGYGIGGPGGRRGLRMKNERAPVPMMAMSAPAPPRPRAEIPKATAAFDSMEASESVVAEAEAAPVDDAPDTNTGETQAPEVRSNFSETAFWEPHLVTGNDGSVAFEFTVPDSVTEWNVWVHAITKDLRSGALEQQTKTVKELLVRPYLPRFFREGDRAELEVVVNNAGETELAGALDFEIFDPETEESLLAEFGLTPRTARAIPFQVAAGEGTSVTFPVRAPNRIGSVAVRVIGRAEGAEGGLSDGELRPLPLLPSRLHLAQSRFVTLQDADQRSLTFEDMTRDDPTRIDERLVVTLDAQLFYSVLQALPYLVDYPYECVEQLLNRFLSTGIVTSLYDQYPAVAKMAKDFSQRETRLESWDNDDPNRQMALEETPWLRTARGGADPGAELINVLDPEIARATKESVLAKLREAQTSLGGFPWWPGGPPSPYMTLYLLQGFSRALEFDVEVPKDMVVKAWSYVHRHYLDRLVRDMQSKDCCWELITYLEFVLSSYPDSSWTGGVFSDDDRRRMRDFSFRHWRQHSPRLKGYLALSLHRAGRAEDAQLVFDSVMDSAKTTRDEGTFWAPEDRAWLWYNDNIESHAFALRTLSELGPDDARRHGLVHWLLLNKKLNHWKSTRATAEVIYSLVHYLDREGNLGAREAATVAVGDRRQTFTFEPDRYVGQTQLVVEGEALDPATMSTVEVSKETPGFLFASATWHFSTEELPEEARGDFFSVTRRYFKRVHDGREWTLQPLADGARLEPGDQLEVQLSLRAKHAAEYVHLRDPRGAGFEPESATSRFRWNLGLGWYEEVRDSGTNFFFEWLPAGEHTFRYRVRASLAGTFRVGPATLQSMYAPEFVGYSSGTQLNVSGKP